ncbi:G/U mismatch-specific DNA glycosylase [Longispora urticae]
MDKPTPAEVAAAAGRTIPDVLAPDLDVLFCGINPGLWSAAVGHHFARPGNRFWPALHRSGFTPEQLSPIDSGTLPAYRLGLTDLVARASARADEIGYEELVAGGKSLVTKLEEYRPAWLAVLGVGAYRWAFGTPAATVGPQPAPLGDTRVWVLPNPSGLNAHYTLERLVEEFGKLRAEVGAAG